MTRTAPSAGSSAAHPGNVLLRLSANRPTAISARPIAERGWAVRGHKTPAPSSTHAKAAPSISSHALDCGE